MKDLDGTPSCCKKVKITGEKSFLTGLISGLIPHTFCILFIVFSTLGVTSATFLFKGLLLNRNFFYYLIALSFVFASLSAIIYLNRNGILSLSGIKRSLRYLSILYGSTIAINLLLFLVIFPATANFRNTNQQFNPPGGEAGNLTMKQSFIILKVDIPCSGHASLITSELKKVDGVIEIKFRLPNLFDVYFNPARTTEEKILNLDIFKTYKAEAVKG